MNRLSSFLSLFASTGTLVCCALPALFVTLGMGAAFASLTSTFPGLLVLNQYKIELFIFAGLMLALSGYFQFRNRFEDCPIDTLREEACKKTRSWSVWVFYISVLIYLIGFFFAFIAVRFL